jgi:hypothetical protein
MILLNTKIHTKDGRTIELDCRTTTTDSHSILNKRSYPGTDDPSLLSDELGALLFETVRNFLREKQLTP